MSVLGFGCTDLGREGRGRCQEACRTVAAAIDYGVTLFDTANSYVNGESERLLGRALAGRRHEVVLCSKAGHGFWASLPLQRWVGPVHGRSARNFRPAFLEMAVTGSLRRLRTDYLDVLYLHNPPAAVVGRDDVFSCLAGLRERGYVRFLGISCRKDATVDEAKVAVGREGVSVVQIPTSPAHMVDPSSIAADAERRGVALIGRQPFAHGALLATAGPESTSASSALTAALTLEGLASVLVGMRRHDHLCENVATVTALRSNV